MCTCRDNRVFELNSAEIHIYPIHQTLPPRCRIQVRPCRVRIELLTVLDSAAYAYKTRTHAASHSLFKRYLTVNAVFLTYLRDIFEHYHWTAGINDVRLFAFKHVKKCVSNKALSSC